MLLPVIFVPLFIAAYFIFDKSSKSNEYKQKRFGVAVIIYLVLAFPGFLLALALENILHLDIYTGGLISAVPVMLVCIVGSRAIAERFWK
jgi:hypothetical protein